MTARLLAATGSVILTGWASKVEWPDFKKRNTAEGIVRKGEVLDG
jgi:hypothetical protein